jgi:hypothetical protein
MSKTIAIEFDGAVHGYSRGWVDGSVYDPPVPGVFDAIRQLQALGFAVLVVTSRNVNDVANWIFKRSDMPVIMLPETLWYWDRTDIIGVTNRKLHAELYIDPRGLRFTDWATALANTAVRTGLYDEAMEIVRSVDPSYAEH